MAEHDIRSIWEVLRSALLDRQLEQTKWRRLLPELVFALNCSHSIAIKAVPYEEVFGRKAILPIDLLMNPSNITMTIDSLKPDSYAEELNIELKHMFDQVIKKLNISKERMEKEYDKNICVYNYDVGSKVWLKVKHYKSGETRKLSPCCTGPWTVVQKLPNGVNFEIRNDTTKEKKIVHDDQLSPAKVREIEPDASSDSFPVPRRVNIPVRTTNYSSESESEISDSDVGVGVDGFG